MALTALLAALTGAIAGTLSRAPATTDHAVPQTMDAASMHDLALQRLTAAAEHRLTEERVAALRAAEPEPPGPRHGRRHPRSHADPQPIPWPPAILGTAGPTSHDPDELLVRAARFLRDGLDLTIERRTLPQDDILAGLSAARLHVVPEKRHGQIVGFLVRDAYRSPVFLQMGVQSGDILTAVNGYPLTSADVAPEVYAQVRDQRRALFEVARGNERVMLFVQAR